jgi:hypothetical protein
MAAMPNNPLGVPEGVSKTPPTYARVPESPNVHMEKTAEAKVSDNETFATTEAVSISGKRAIDLGKSYEAEVRNLYGDVPFGQRQYEALVNGKWVDGVADNVVQIGDKNTAIEAKFVDNWATSLRNPASSTGFKPWSVAE